MVRWNPAYDDIDDVLADTFPASDPPAWTPGVARLMPEVDDEMPTPAAPERGITTGV